jgi:hypothetical protein
VLGPIPDPRTTVPTCLSGHLDDALACSPPRPDAVNDAGIAAEAAATRRQAGSTRTSPRCSARLIVAPSSWATTSSTRDDNHVTIEYAQVLGRSSVRLPRALAKR